MVRWGKRDGCEGDALEASILPHMRNRLVLLLFCASMVICSAQSTTPPLAASPAQPTGMAAKDDSLAKINVPGDEHFKPDQPIVTPPKLTKFVNPKLSKQAQKERFIGKATARIHVIVGADGKPENPYVVDSAGHGFDEMALDAARKYRFEPATRDGKPVAVVLMLDIEFSSY